MNLRALGTIALLSVALSAGSPRAAAAPPVTRTTDLERRLRDGETIFITDQDGQQTEARFVRASSTVVTVLLRGVEQEISVDRIARIDKRDSVWNGATPLTQNLRSPTR